MLGMFVFQGTWRVTERFSIAYFPSLFIGVFVFQGDWRATGMFSIAYFPSFVCLLVCLACLCFTFRVPGE